VSQRRSTQSYLDARLYRAATNPGSAELSILHRSFANLRRLLSPSRRVAANRLTLHDCDTHKSDRIILGMHEHVSMKYTIFTDCAAKQDAAARLMALQPGI